MANSEYMFLLLSIIVYYMNKNLLFFPFYLISHYQFGNN